MNPLQRYRRAQRRARTLFEPFTSVHCEGCPTPCCRKPARIRPVDIVLVEELGFQLPQRDVVAPILRAAADLETEDAGTPCDFLGERGCLFPSDLRPFGCTAFICDPMRRLLPAEELARVEAAVAELTEAHSALMDALHS